MSGNKKEKIAVRNNAGKKTPAATAPMANANANATVLEKIENLAVTFRHREVLPKHVFRKHFGRVKPLLPKTAENPEVNRGKRKRNKSITQPGRYVATEQAQGSFSTWRPSSSQARSLRSDRARTQLGRYVTTEHAHGSVAT
ncbi:hypothetical protein F2Q70_00036489 [Brassica cretica]|uniref:Uncharacterized protein n=1 Tax=Brassica cretica TaxID=69181 RepID=A0A8S9JYL4_BRACR|nr:hypothetical protein F2Q70_00036489 [Brassica cretica]